MTTECRICGATIIEKKESRHCPNGCQIYTAQAVGSQYHTPRKLQQGSDGQLWEAGGSTGSMRRMPTCRE